MSYSLKTFKSIPELGSIRQRIGRLFYIVMVCLLLTVSILSIFMLQPAQLPQITNLKLKSQKLIYQFNESPVIDVSIDQKPSSGWHPILGLAQAVSQMQTKIFYNNQLVNIAYKISPNGNNYQLKMQPDGLVKPGKYTVDVSLPTSNGEIKAEQSFAWGVLAINFDKPIYQPGQTAFIQMAVLDSNGHTLCSAPLWLEVRSPTGEISKPNISPSGICNGDTYVDKPDYSAYYQTSEAGSYTVTLHLADSAYTEVDSFQVSSAAPFYIARVGPTRVFPPHPYQMTITVTPSADFSGQVREGLPSGFNVNQTDSDAITGKTSSGPQIMWTVSWQAAHQYELSYSFMSAPLSPAFYFLRPLQFNNTSLIYHEQRHWQIAGDGISEVQEDTADSTSGSAVTVPLTSASTTGDLLVAIITSNSQLSNGCTYTVADTNNSGHTFTAASAVQSASFPPSDAVSGSGHNSEVTMADYVNAPSMTSVKATPSGCSSKTLHMIVMEFSGVATSSATDVSNSALGAHSTSSTTKTTPSVTTTNNDDLIIGAINYPASLSTENASGKPSLCGSGCSPSTGWTQTADIGGTSITGTAAWVEVSSTGTYNTEFNSLASDVWGAITASFKSAAVSCSPTVDEEMRGGQFFCNGTKQPFFWAT